LWQAIQDVLDELGPQGMSGDETDLEASTCDIKKTTKLKLPWISEAITNLWCAVDTYTNAIDSECLMVRHMSGNLGLSKSGASKEAENSPVPKNRYNESWVIRFHAGEKIWPLHRKGLKADTKIDIQ
jgi:hypothetical protein